MRRDSHRPQVLAFVRDRIEQTGFAPSCREIGDGLGISGVASWRHVQALIAEGKLTAPARGKFGLPDPVGLESVGTDRLRAELARRGVTMDALQEPRQDRGRPCAANGCGRLVERGKLMCRDHWFRLPTAYRRDILEAFSARQPRAYQDAVERARDHLGGFTTVVSRVD